MYYELAKQVVVTDAAQQVSQAASLAGANAVQLSIEAVSFGVTTLQVIVDVGNDLQNWSAAGTLTLDSVGYKTGTVSDLAASYARLRYNVSSGTGTAILSGGFETKQL